MMNNLYKYVMMSVLMFTSCVSEHATTDPPEEEWKEETETVPVQFSISLGSYSSYSSVEEDDKDVTGEIGTITEVDLYVFREDGRFYTHEKVGVSGSGTFYESDPFKFRKGNWYMYVLIHKPADFIEEPTAATTMMEFEKQKIEFGDAILSYRTFMATPVRELKTITGSGNPEHIELKVGHVLTKVAVTPGIPKAAGDLSGTFSNRTNTTIVSFGISCEPTSVSLIGQWEGEFMGDFSQMVSPHYHTYTLGDFRSPLFRRPDIGTPYWYTTENSNYKPNIENSSCFILEYRYKPTSEEIHTLNHETGGTLDAYNSFYVADFANGKRLIYNEDPSGRKHPQLGEVKKVSKHSYGECYYRVPIADPSKSTNSLIYSTIRNYYYVLTVHSISGLGKGEYDDWSEWEPPWEEEAEIDVTLKVEDWVYYDIPVDLE